MAKKKRGLKKFRERAAEKRVVRSNPAFSKDLLYEIGPAFGAYAATRFAGRIASKLGGAKLGKHAAPLGSVAVAGAAWLLAHRIPKIAQFHTPIIVGSSIAAVQSLVQTYLPKYGWIVGDVEQAPAVAATPTPQGLGGYAGRRRRKKRRMQPVGDEFDALEQMAQERADDASGGETVMDDEIEGNPGPAVEETGPSVMPDEYEIDTDQMDEDFGSLSGGLSN